MLRIAASRRSWSFLLILSGLWAAPPERAFAQRIPTPESVFGFPVGADRKLFGYDQSIEYFRRLAAASKNVRLINVGTTSYGHAWTAVLISSEDNLKKLDTYRAMNMRLAHPEGLDDNEAHRLAREGKVFVDISGGLHASEIAGSQHTPQLAYELLSRAKEPETKAILDNVVFFLWPSINPDGQDIVVNNCRARDAGLNPGPMELYQKYIGHDNNRDSYMMNVVESRVIQRTWREWEPDIIYVHHQASPEPTRIWIPPFADPVGLRAPPIPAREINTIGSYIAQSLDAHGQPGATAMLATYDAWYPGYIDYMGVYQNIPSWWTETQGGTCATPKPAGDPKTFGADYRDLRPTPLYLSPWTGGVWHLRDAVDYMVTASLATLSYAAKFKEEILYNRYQSGRNTIAKYQKEAPFAYIIPQAQHDPMAPVELLRRMAFHGIRIYQLTREGTQEGARYPAGTWVIPMDQEYAELVRELFEVQHYPQIGDDTPYDAAGWTLPYQMDVEVVEVKAPLEMDLRAAMRAVEGTPTDARSNPEAPFTTNPVAAGIVAPRGGVTGTGDQVALDPAQNNSFRLINRALAAGAKLTYSEPTTNRGGQYLLSGLPAMTVDSLATSLSVQAVRTTTAASPAVPAPTRIALYKSAPGNMDEGWTEWLLDTHGFTYTLITPSDLQAGNLNQRFDVILFASQTVGSGGRGGGGGAGAASGGRGGAPGGAGAADPAIRLDEFVRTGGTAVFWNGGATGAINTLGLPVRNVVAGLSRNDYFTGGSIMQVITDPTHPVMAGMPERADVFVSGSPVFTTTSGFEGTVLAKYPQGESPLRSGYLRGESFMQGFAAALDVNHGQGHVILIAFQPQWRGQPMGTFRIVFNSAFFAGQVAAQAHGAAGFWTAPAAPAAPGGRAP